jgi:hypothetical protein
MFHPMGERGQPTNNRKEVAKNEEIFYIFFSDGRRGHRLGSRIQQC